MILKPHPDSNAEVSLGVPAYSKSKQNYILFWHQSLWFYTQPLAFHFFIVNQTRSHCLLQTKEEEALGRLPETLLN